jgi:hypothetical protein
MHGGPRSLIEELHAELAAREDAGVHAERRRQNLLSRHPCSVMTSCDDGGDRLSVQRGEVDWQREKSNLTGPKYSYDFWSNANILCDLAPSSLLSFEGLTWNAR